MNKTVISPVRDLLHAVRSDVAERRRARAARRSRERELTRYTTAREVYDVLDALKGHEGPQVEEIRAILLENLDRARTDRAAA